MLRLLIPSRTQSKAECPQLHFPRALRQQQKLRDAERAETEQRNPLRRVRPLSLDTPRVFAPVT
jgi:hypothetical protein